MKKGILILMAAALLFVISACATAEFGVGVGGGTHYEDDYR
jgi:hypothetical protein